MIYDLSAWLIPHCQKKATETFLCDDKQVDEYREELRRSNDRVSRQGKELHLLAQTSAEAIREYKTLQDQYEYEVVSSKAAHTRANQVCARMGKKVYAELVG